MEEKDEEESGTEDVTKEEEAEMKEQYLMKHNIPE
jgi:hypothetical protein